MPAAAAGLADMQALAEVKQQPVRAAVVVGAAAAAILLPRALLHLAAALEF